MVSRRAEMTIKGKQISDVTHGYVRYICRSMNCSAMEVVQLHMTHAFARLADSYVLT